MKVKAIAVFIMIVMIAQVVSFAETTQNTTFELSVDKKEQNVGKEVNLTIKGNNIKNMYAYEIVVEFENSKVQFIKGVSSISGFSVNAKKGENAIVFGNTKVGNVPEDNGNLVLCTLTFKVLKKEDAKFTLKTVKIVDLIAPGQTTSEIFDSNVALRINSNKDTTSNATAINFVDLQNHWAKSSVDILASKGIVSGYSDGIFKPDNYLTRAEGIVMVLKTAEIEAVENAKISTPDAADVPEWAKGYVQSALNNGIISGYNDGTIRMNNDITREEILAMILKATKSELSFANTLKFSDLNEISEWAMKYVETAVSKQLINGYPDNTFRGRNNVTRGEISVILSKLLK